MNEKAPPSRRGFSPLRALATGLRRMSRLLDFVAGGAGREHGVGRWDRLVLLRKILRARRGVGSGSDVLQHLLLAEEVLRIPPEVEGDVVECGCLHGATTIPLSLACALAGRRLFVCDSFEGLPVSPADDGRMLRSDGTRVDWRAGQWKSLGGLDGVQRVVARLGAAHCCRFVKGLFADTLPHLETDRIVLVFEDADLVTSVEDCLMHLWPKMVSGAKFFCHEPWFFDVVLLFHDRAWWGEKLGLRPPGFKGSGVGLPQARGIGYATKLDPERPQARAILDPDDPPVTFRLASDPAKTADTAKK